MRAWKGVLARVGQTAIDKQFGMVAAAVGFYGLLALFPALLALLSIYVLVMSGDEAQRHVQLLADNLPAGVRSIFMEQARAVLRDPKSQVWPAVVSTSATLLASSNGTAVLMKAVSIAYDQTKGRSFMRQRGRALLLTLVLQLGAMSSLFLIAVQPAAAQWLGWASFVQRAFDYGRWPALAVLMGGSLASLYALAPHRSKAHWRWTTWGAAIATTLWIGVSMGFAWFLRVANVFEEVYGTVAGVIALMLWLFLSALVIMLGAAFNAQLEVEAEATEGTSEPD